MQVAVELDDSLKAESSTTVRMSSILEAVNVVLNRVDWDVKMLGSFSKHLWVMDSLSP